jgi:hypothetical protein
MPRARARTVRGSTTPGTKIPSAPAARQAAARFSVSSSRPGSGTVLARWTSMRALTKSGTSAASAAARATAIRRACSSFDRVPSSMFTPTAAR